MFTINLYQFSKRENSTKRPSGNGLSFSSCQLKSGCSIISPVIEFNIGITNPEQYNYAYIPDFDRYYFIEDWYWSEGLWNATMSCDVLATYKTEIGSFTGYVLRSASAYDGNIVDSLYPTKATISYGSQSFTNPLITTQSGGCFVLGIQGAPDSASWSSGSITYYVFNYTEMTKMLKMLLDDNFLLSDMVKLVSDDASIPLQKNLINPLDYIKSAFYLPINYDDIGLTYTSGATAPVVFDWLLNGRFGTTPITAKVLNRQLWYDYSITINIPKHPQTSTRGNYVNGKQYSSYELSIAPFGIVDLSSDDLITSTSLSVNVSIDLIDGMGLLKVYNQGGTLITQTKTQLMVPIQLTQISKGMTSALSGSLKSWLGEGAGNVASLALDAVIGAKVGVNLGSFMADKKPKQQSMGSNGGYLDLSMNNILYATFSNLVDDDITNHGRPLMQMRQLGTLIGYIIVQDGDIQLDSTQSESQQVRNYLESGFYYE